MLPGVWRRLLLACLACVSPLVLGSSSAQDIDSVIYAGGAGRTVLDQIESAAERDAFGRLLAEREAAEKLAAARTFLADYPQSRLLSQVYEIASKAAIDVGELESARRYGEESLRLLPENPALLVPLANVEAHLGRMDEAAAHAREALRYLHRFVRPVGFTDQEWLETAQKLEASARYVLGLTFATRGFALQGDPRRKWLEVARESLERSRALYRQDPLSAYLLGLVLLDLGASQEAADELAASLDPPGVAPKRALEELRELYRSSGSKTSFEDYVHAKAARAAKRSYVAPRAAEAPSHPVRYAGSEACRGCHSAIHDSWSRTGMARMFRAYRAANLIAGSAWPAVFVDEQGREAVRMSIDGDRRYLSFRGEAGDWVRYPVDYTIGSKWQQAYATRLPNGRIHVFPIQYSAIEKRWVNFWKILDDGVSERSTIAAFPSLTTATSYQLHCAACHASQVQAETGRVEPSEITFHESGVNCEMCHGPSGDHVTAMKDKGKSLDAASQPIRFSQLDPQRSVEICAQCHMQSRVIEPGPHGEINYSGAAEPFFQQIRSRPYSEFSLRAIYKDGRFRETTFITESFLRSACYQRGGATCVSCHDPHPPNQEANPKSLKFPGEPNAMCLQCHASLAASLRQHTHHRPESEASQCASCHMPKIMRSMLFQAGTHRIDDIPSAEMTARFGPEESPNACLICHVDRNVDWLRDQLARWGS